MTKVVHCECGVDVTAESDDEIVEEVQAHVRAEHPDLVSEFDRPRILSMVHEH